tara:strand:- start:14932 stop:15282 length:351 start_codon:yes stop_codon:yes gene_type:complete
MKTKSVSLLIVFTTVFFTLSSFKSAINIQESTVIAIYDGHESYGYNFIGKHADGETFTLTFQKVDDAVLKEFDLESEAFIKATFKITYKTKVLVTKDADGFEDEEEVNTITKLEKL